MELAKSKLADIAQHCIYEISTGKWSPGFKLPSVRDAEKLWGVNRLTVLAAYRELEKIGLVVSKDRSGYYVAKSEDHISSIRHADDLNKIYNKVFKLIIKESNLDPAYIFKYCDTRVLAESRSQPNYAFLECTSQQADDHSIEIYQMLNIHVHPIQLNDDANNFPEIPSSVNTLMTTGFHIQEVTKIGKKLNKKIVNIPIEVDPVALSKAFKGVAKAAIVEFESNMSSNIAHDVKKLMGDVEIEQVLTNDLEKDMAELLLDSSIQLLLLSPRVWGRISKEIKKDKKVKLIRFRISDSSWRIISKTLNIPFN